MSETLLHLVFGGVVSDPAGTDFVDASEIHLVGMYPNNAEALIAWKGVSHTKVDDAHYKYVIVHLHKVLEPELEDS
jgi:hypothetical protein